jgi:hypothetical protein
MEPGTAVALRRAPQWKGRIRGKVMDGIAHVRFDRGGSGNFRLEDLVPLQDKTWPPATEHKGTPA